MLQAMFMDLFCLGPTQHTLFWRKDYSKRIKAGTIAGCYDKRSGRVIVVVNRQRYYADDVTHCITHGSLPDK